MTPLSVLIPGEPVSQGRPRFARVGKFVRTYDPAKSRNWKATAQAHFRDALQAAGITAPFQGPLECRILARFTCPKSDWRKREPVPQRPHAKRPDAENVGKAVLDSATGVVWLDDAQVAKLTIVKVVGAQGEAPGVEVQVWPICAGGAR